MNLIILPQQAKQSAADLVTLKWTASRRADGVEEAGGCSGIEDGDIGEGRCGGRRPGHGGGEPSCSERRHARRGQRRRRAELQCLAVHGHGQRRRRAGPQRADTPADRGGPGGGRILCTEDGGSGAQRSGDCAQTAGDRRRRTAGEEGGGGCRGLRAGELMEAVMAVAWRDVWSGAREWAGRARE
jgi:hypothetical protein